METKYNYAIFIGRFQPFHIGHLHVFEQALKSADRLIVLVGSSGGARTLRNPFTFAERVAMMRASLPAEIAERIDFKALQDYTYNDSAWVEAVTQIVTNAVEDATKSIALVGHDKDETTYYLKLFPNWAYIEVGNLDGINATAVRRRYFTDDFPTQFDSDILRAPTIAWLRDFGKTEDYIALTREYHAIERYKSAWKNTPYPVIFTTADALVRYGDEILLIQRKHYPGKDLWALPGGFLDVEETLLDGCLRELTEETQLAVDKATLKESLVSHKVFDNPKRSTRGRVITNCYYFDISHLPEKPAAQAADDAQSLAWVQLDALDRATLFEDHYFIIQSLLSNHD